MSRSPAADRVLARICLTCPVCRRARRRQRGVAYLLVRRVEDRLCPCCRAYARVFGRRAHEPCGPRPPLPP